MAKVVRYVGGYLRLVEVTDQDVVSTYSPSDYQPTEVSSEGTDKLSAHLKGIDLKLGSLGTSGFSDSLFTSDGLTESYQLTNTFSEATVLEVYYDGVYKLENRDWERGTSNSLIDTVDDSGTPYPLPGGTSLKVRQFNEGYNQTVEVVEGDGSTVGSTLTNIFNSTTNIDFILNGVLYKEDDRWERDTNTNKVFFLTDSQVQTFLPTGSTLAVRIIPEGQIVDEDFNVSGENPVLSVTETFDDAQKIDVYVGGFHMIENEDFTRNTSTNEITLSIGHALTTNDNVLVRVWIA